MRTSTLTSLALTLFLSLALTSFSGCSSTSSGLSQGANGDGVFSDEDLALAERKWGQGSIPEAQAGGAFGQGGESGPFQDVLFDFDSADIPLQYRAQLENDSKVLLRDPSIQVEIEGHCDKRGTNEYNLALGKERAKTVARYLVNLGVNPAQLSTITYGEEIPLDPNDSEQAFETNRRAHFALYRNKNQ